MKGIKIKLSGKMKHKKSVYKKVTVAAFLVMMMIFIAPAISYAQPPPPPPPTDPGPVDAPVGGTPAPVEGGSLILIGLAVAYTVKRIAVRKEKDIDIE